MRVWQAGMRVWRGIELLRGTLKHVEIVREIKTLSGMRSILSGVGVKRKLR